MPVLLAEANVERAPGGRPGRLLAVRSDAVTCVSACSSLTIVSQSPRWVHSVPPDQMKHRETTHYTTTSTNSNIDEYTTRSPNIHRPSLRPPARRPKGFISPELVERNLIPVNCVRVTNIAPPSLDAIFADRPATRVLQAEEDDDRAERVRRVEASGQNVVVLGPPGKVAATDHVVEDEADDGGGDVV